VVVALGSVTGTLKDVIDSLREDGVAVGLVALTSFRPFPDAAMARALAGATRVVSLERAFSLGRGGIVEEDLRRVLWDRAGEVALTTVAAGLGGREITSASLAEALRRADRGELAPLEFLDLDEAAVAAHLAAVGSHTEGAAS